MHAIRVFPDNAIPAQYETDTRVNTISASCNGCERHTASLAPL